MTSTDYNGIAAIIGATLGGTGILTTSILAILTFVRQGARDRKIDEVHQLVNGMSHELKEADMKVAFGEGEKAGIAAERADPMSPAGT